ncbi:sodium/solute symporter [bacterium]|nr:sodium/solute symporter [bacterium]
MGSLSVLDYIVVLLYLAVTLFIGVWVSRYIQTGREFFLAGRTLPWWAVGVSLVATDIGGTDIIGVGGAAYRYGLAVGNFEWIGCVPAMIVGAFVFIPHFWRSGVTTIPEFLEKRFDVSVRTAVAICWLLFMACNIGVMLLASAKLMEALAGWPVAWTIVGIAILVGFYTFSGGLAAVVYTDALQGLLMIAGCGLVVGLGLYELGGITGLRDAVVAAGAESAQVTVNTKEHFRLVLPVDTTSPFPWTGILFGLAFITSPAYWIGNQAIVQRALGARSEFEAKASYVWGALLKNLIPFIIVIPGMIALAKFPNLADADQALPKLIGSLMPAGGKGIFLAAFMAAMMSSVDSYLNSATTIFTNDIYLRFLRPTADERRLLFVGRTITVLLSIWGIFFAFLLSQSDAGIYAIFQTLMSFFNGPAFAVLLAGLVTRGVNRYGALSGFLIGVLTAVSLYLLNNPTVCEYLKSKPLFQISDPFLYYSIWAFLATWVVMLVVSYWTESEPSEKLAMSLRATRAEAAT